MVLDMVKKVLSQSLEGLHIFYYEIILHQACRSTSCIDVLGEDSLHHAVYSASFKGCTLVLEGILPLCSLALLCKTSSISLIGEEPMGASSKSDQKFAEIGTRPCTQ